MAKPSAAQVAGSAAASMASGGGYSAPGPDPNDVAREARRAEEVALLVALPTILPLLSGWFAEDNWRGRSMRWLVHQYYWSPIWWAWWALTLFPGLAILDAILSALLIPIPLVNVAPSVVIGFVWWAWVLPIPWRRAQFIEMDRIEAEVRAEEAAKDAKRAAAAKPDAASPAADGRILLGQSTGRLRERGLGHAIREGGVVKTSPRSLEEGLTVIGGSGSGKSSCVARPLADGWMQYSPEAAVLAVAQKSSAAAEMAIISSRNRPAEKVWVIGPKHQARWNIIEGLSPEAIGRAFVAALPKGNGQDNVWRSAAEQRIAAFAAALTAAPFNISFPAEEEGEDDVVWPIANDAYSLMRILAAPQSIVKAFLTLVERQEDNPAAAAAAVGAKMTDAALPKDTRASIYLSIGAVAGMFLPGPAGSPFVAAFGMAEGPGRAFPGLGVLEDGAMVVVDCDPAQFPQGARLVGSLLREHLVGAARRRADRAANDVLYLADEYASYASPNDADLFRTCRSARIAPIPIFQSVSTLAAEVGRDVAQAICSGSRHLLVLATSDQPTVDLVAHLAGKTERKFESRTSGSNLSSGHNSHSEQGRSASGGFGWSDSTSTAVQQRDIIDAEVVAGLRRNLGPGVAEPFAEAIYFGSPDSHSRAGQSLGEILICRTLIGEAAPP